MASARKREGPQEKRPNGAVKAHYYVQVIRAQKGGVYQPFTPVRFDTIEGALQACNKLQADFDDDCEPCRVYVLDSIGVPLHAGGRK